MSDQVREFTGKVISDLCNLLGIIKIRMLPYHPQTNRAVKHMHQTLWRMIEKLKPEKRVKWPSHLGPIIITYNAMRYLVTGYSPYFLIFECRPRLPVDLLFPTVRWEETTQTTDEYVTPLYDKLKKAQQQKRHYNHKASAVELYLEDKVLVKLDSFTGQWQKLKN